jgi:hypothetical protein
MDIPQLFGKPWQAKDFHDDRLGAALEKLAKGDLPRAYHAIAWEALQREGIVLDQAHVDTTSLSVQGTYEQASGDDSALRIDYGYSKDNRRDLKQIMFGLGNVQSLPLFADVMAGQHVRQNVERFICRSNGGAAPAGAVEGDDRHRRLGPGHRGKPESLRRPAVYQPSPGNIQLVS